MIVSAWLFVVASAFAEQTVTMTELVGTWRTPCVAREGVSNVSTLFFNIRGDMNNTSQVYLGANCTSPYMTAGADFQFELGSDRLSGTATPHAATLAFNSVEAVAAANAGAGACGITDWQLNVARPVFGLPCSPGGAVRVGIGKVDARRIRVMECASPTSCTTNDYVKVD